MMTSIKSLLTNVPNLDRNNTDDSSTCYSVLHKKINRSIFCNIRLCSQVLIVFILEKRKLYDEKFR